MNTLDIIEKLFTSRASEREISDLKVAFQKMESLIKEKDLEIANLNTKIKELEDKLKSAKPSKAPGFKLSGFDRGGNDNMI